MCNYRDVCMDYNPMCDANVGEVDIYPECLTQYKDKVKLLYWSQETAESGRWLKTRKMPRKVAMAMIKSNLYDRAEIVDA